MELEVKGPRKAYDLAHEVLYLLPSSVFVQVFERPKLDLTR
ncbi:hypothetical protein D082_50820 (plasmid) [Synechocystis sp. PCC 6714]|nr:hypothetical protein D082_50820 [Synechocystis sp. PCC 6714]